MSIKASIILRVRIAFLLVMLFAVAIMVKLVDTQVVSGKKWIARSEQRNVRLREIQAIRGNIYSNNGSLLATSLPFYKVAFDPHISRTTEYRNEIYKKGIRDLCRELSMFYGDRTEEGYYRLINSARANGKHYLLINSRMINYHEKKMMSEWPIFKEGKMNGGVIFEMVNRRFTPFSHLAGRTIGYIKEGKKNGNKAERFGAGIEYSFDSLLRGQNGKAWFTKIGGGGWRSLSNSPEVKPRHGFSVHTTLDINLQDVTEDALMNSLISNNADNGCAVVMEVKTGEIRAMANLTRVSKEDEEPKYAELYNHAVGIAVEPGSTFKLASVIALLESGVKLNDSIQTGGGTYKFYNRNMTDSNEDGYGKLSFQQTFEKSSNIGISKLMVSKFGGNLPSQERFIQYLDEFGLTKPLTFQISGVASPVIKRPGYKTWSGTSLPWMSIGYELAISPLHILTFYNAVANDGKMIQPMIVKRVTEADKVIKEYTPVVLKEKICSDKSLVSVRKMLEGVVEHGTAKKLKNAQYKIAGKTGTAQKLVEGQYSKEYYASFVGYFPANNPKYSIIVAIDRPRNGLYYGSDVAAPVFKEIADRVFAYDLSLHPPFVVTHKKDTLKLPNISVGNYDDLVKVCEHVELSYKDYSKHNPEWVSPYTDTLMNNVGWKRRDIHDDLVPNVKGMSLRDALFILENRGLKVDYVGKGRVKTQSIPSGTKIQIGTRITLELS